MVASSRARGRGGRGAHRGVGSFRSRLGGRRGFAAGRGAGRGSFRRTSAPFQKRESTLTDQTVWKHDKFQEQQDDEDQVNTNNKKSLTNKLAAIRRAGGGGGSSDGSTKVKISNLDYEVNDDELTALFENSGGLVKAKVHYDKSGRSNGVATVEFSSYEEAQAVVEEFGGVELDGKILEVSLLPQGKALNTGNVAIQRNIVVTTTNERFRGTRGGRRPLRGVTRGARGLFRGRGRGAPATADSLDQELDAYMGQQ